MDQQHLLALALLMTALLAFPAPAAAAAQPPSSPRHGDLQLRDTLDAAARSVERALAALTTAAAPPPPTVVGPFSAGSTTPPSSSSASLIAAAAREDCAELLGDSLDLLAAAGAARHDDAVAWLSAALTNHDTCADGLAEAGLLLVSDHHAATIMNTGLAAARATVRDALAALDHHHHAASTSTAPAPAPNSCDCTGNETTVPEHDACGFPRWMASTYSRMQQQLLVGPEDWEKLKAAADLVVAKDGTGTHATIGDAVDAAPHCSARRTVIHVKAGTYDEVVRVGSKKTNLVFVGDGAGRTVVTGNKSVADHVTTTFQTATFAVSGSGFMMVDMTVDNRAGPARHQAVALRVSADRAVVQRCAILGYQDTLYAHSHRQFYRDCDVHGTVDFVFGNAAAVFQRCRLRSRRAITPSPSSSQTNVVTAQDRREPCQKTGFVLQDCQFLPDHSSSSSPAPAPALSPSSSPSETMAPATYLGRPWRLYSRVVVMRSYIGAHVPPRGWMPWNATSYALDTLYYAEYMNRGPGAGLAGRVTWRGHRVIADAAEADRFTVARFIDGASWLPATGVHFDAGLYL